jgi:FtsP/CotA-like multicopper oxidase with cupredoxin domain
MKRILCALGMAALFVATPFSSFCAVVPATTPCPRYAAGTQLVEARDLFSSHGILRVNLSYKTRVDADGNTLYCFTTDDGVQSPTLHVHPGDELLITLKNDLPSSMTPSFSKHSMPGMAMPELSVSSDALKNCGGMVMTASSVNVHYHGTNTPPMCHQDEVIKTLINAGETFQYDLHFPYDEPPGLYWYHPHIHGIAEAAVQGRSFGRDHRGRD